MRWIVVALLVVASSLSLFAMIPGSRAVGGWVVRRGGRLELVRLARPLLVLLVLGLSAAAACEDDKQTPCDRWAQRSCDCGTCAFDLEYYADMCEANLDGEECDQACEDGQACMVECSKLDDCDKYQSCVDVCFE